MEFVNVPITEFYRHSLYAARNRGFMWVVTLLAREADIDGLYSNLRKTWTSLDSITGKYFLFVFAGKENITHDDRWNSRVCDSHIGYFSEYNDYVRIINPNAGLSEYYLQHEFHKNKQRNMDYLEKSQTSAVNSLRDYFSINERDIPCLVFTRVSSLHNVRGDTYVVPISGNDIYGYFKQMFNLLDPMLKQIDDSSIRLKELASQEKKLTEIVKSISLGLDGRILALRNELLIYAEKNIVDDTGRPLLECINNFLYGKFNQPLRGMLNRYVDLAKNYEKKSGIRFDASVVNANISRSAAVIAQSKAELSALQRERTALDQLCGELSSQIEKIIRGSKMEKMTYNENKSSITVTGGTVQIITATDNAKVNATQHVDNDETRLAELISNVRNALPTSVPAYKAKAINTKLNSIEKELKRANPRKSVLNRALNGLKAIKGVAEFGAAVAELIKFVQPLF